MAQRGVAGAANTAPDGRLFVEVEEHTDPVPVDGNTRNLEREYRAVVEEILELRGADSRVSSFLRSITEPGALADTGGYSPDLSYENKVKLLQTNLGSVRGLQAEDQVEITVDGERVHLVPIGGVAARWMREGRRSVSKRHTSHRLSTKAARLADEAQRVSS